MNSTTEILVMLPVVLVAISIIASRLRTSPAILLVITGVLLALVPGLPTVSLAPQFVLLFVLPPVIYSAAVAMSWREFRFNIRPISLLAVGCVTFTTGIAAAAAHWLLGLPWPEGFVLGAIVSPPDAVAPLALARKMQLPRRLLVILEGEGLANDATALVFYRFAVVAVSVSSFSFGRALTSFAAILVGEILWGLIVGWGILKLRHWTRNPRIEILLSVLTPFVAYWPPQQLGGSGVLATVTCGLYISWNGLRLISSPTRLQGIFFWDFLIYCTEGMLFLVTGLQARALLAAFKTYSTSQLLVSAAILSAVIIAARFVWVYPATYLPRWLSPKLARADPSPPWQWPFLLGYTGIRGIVSLAAALALPLTLENGQPFPHRDLILFLTYSVILVTLVAQGLLLPVIIRSLGLVNMGRRELKIEREEEFAARRAAIEAALIRLDTICKEKRYPLGAFQSLRTVYRERLRQVEYGAHEPPHHDALQGHEDILAQLIAAEREQMIALYRTGNLKDEPRRRIERDLDLREAEVANLRLSD
ncbi:MAG TPA: Na+/H+ antiporter [Steroidobacteraceae bacterium]